jgi:flagellar biosynthesis anti-sigma factor FlgM
MKVSRTDIQRIYQDQIRKTQTDKGEGFKKVMQTTTGSTGEATKAFHPPSGVNLTNPVFAGKPVPAADPVETMKFAAEVVASQPDVRSERIEQLKKLIDGGQYNVPAEAVAERLLRSRHLTESWEG